MDILIYYVLPNVALFGGLYALAKVVEHATQYAIDNWDELMKRLG